MECGRQWKEFEAEADEDRGRDSTTDEAPLSAGLTLNWGDVIFSDGAVDALNEQNDSARVGGMVVEFEGAIQAK